MNRARLEIHCDETALDGITGNGVGVAVLATGIYIHEDLKGKILGFKAFVHGKKLPYDDTGHGTHVSAMIAGSGAASGGLFKGIADVYKRQPLIFVNPCVFRCLVSEALGFPLFAK